MSTSSPSIEKIINNKKPGEVGGALVGYREAQRQQEKIDPVEEFTSVEAAEQEASRLSGKPISEMSEDDFQRLPVVLLAREMSPKTELHVAFKDPSMTGRWVNCGTKKEDRVAKFQMQGYTAATRDDVSMCHISTTDANGAIRYGDLVLMKIPKIKLWGGYYKQNMETAVSRVERAARKIPVPGESLPIGASYEGTNLTSARTVDADYRKVDGARQLTYAE